MTDWTVEQIFEKMPTAFCPERANGIAGAVQFLIGGDGGGEWVVEIAHGKCRVTSGRIPSPQVTVSADANLLPDVLSGRQNGMMAFMQGKLRIQGDMGLAQKLLRLFDLKNV
ncbi:MAG: SCP2 sterol-binding domain-containing protein [Chloroflexota bacterium]